ncbi:hypothetical protein ANN_22088 [Periplaneta americana]|uniref:Uncharacterized protein n=1 Tax=Periplaneta americana TaxID=6978 RepID=A0ABQ8S759_PERAM|nr:hypothetical protein ANN_22088 [Periplaneta americana]
MAGLCEGGNESPGSLTLNHPVNVNAPNFNSTILASWYKDDEGSTSDLDYTEDVTIESEHESESELELSDDGENDEQNMNDDLQVRE